MQNEHITFRQLAEEAGVSMRQLGIKYGIPRTTYEQWSAGKATPPSYVLELLKKDIEREKEGK